MANPYETQALYNLQRYLLGISRFDPDVPPVDPDGIFGETTRASLMAFQKKYGLPVTGVGDAETWARLFEEYLAGIEAATRPDPVYIFPRYPADYSVGRGDEGPVVSVIQLILRDMKNRRIDPAIIFGSVFRLFTELYTVALLREAGLPPDTIAKRAGIHEYKVKISLRAIGTRTAASLGDTLERCRTLDLSGKSGTADYSGLERLIAEESIRT